MELNYWKKIVNFIQKIYGNWSNFALTMSSTFFVCWIALLFFMNYKGAAVLAGVGSFLITLFFFNPFADFSKNKKITRILSSFKMAILFLGSLTFIILFVMAMLFDFLPIGNQFSRILKEFELIIAFIAFIVLFAIILALIPVALLLLVSLLSLLLSYFIIEKIKSRALESFFIISLFTLIFFGFFFVFSKEKFVTISFDNIFSRITANEHLFLEIIKLVFGFGLVFLHSNYLLKELAIFLKNKKRYF